MPVFSKVRSATSRTGRAIQVFGATLFGVCFLASVLWTLSALYSAYGIWAAIVGGVLSPITYAASVIIVWVSTGNFPVLVLAVYLGALLGVALWMFGKRWDGDDNDF